MASNSRVRSFRRIALAMAVVAIPVMLVAAERTRDRRNSAQPAEQIEMFAGIEKGDIEVQLFPKDSTLSNVVIKNKTARPLSIKLPEAFAGVPALAQLGLGGGGAVGGGGGAAAAAAGGGGRGGGGQSVGGGMGGMMGGGGMGGGMGMFNIAPEKEGKFRVQTVCLEHGKREPQAAMKYAIKPIEQFTDKPAVKEICRMLGEKKLNQRVAQAAAWHVSNDMSWQELAAKQYKFATGIVRPYFSPAEIQAAMRAVSVAMMTAEKPKPSDEPTNSQNNPSTTH